jgi:hypothetical protein
MMHGQKNIKLYSKMFESSTPYYIKEPLYLRRLIKRSFLRCYRFIQVVQGRGVLSAFVVVVKPSTPERQGVI